MRPPLRYATLVGLLGLALLLAGCGPMIDPDSTQDRATTPADRLSAGHSLTQTFVAHRPRLAAVDVLLAVYPPGQGDDAGDLVLHLRPWPGAADLATARVPVGRIAHNSYYRLAFAPQPDSEGREYYLLVEATTPEPARATVWSSAVDAYPEGESYYDGQPRARDLTFRAYYDYDAPWLAADLASALGRRGWVFLPALAALFLPGLAVQRWLLPDLDLDAAEAAGLWLGLSLAIAPVLLLLATALGLRLGAASVAGLLVVAGLAAIGRAVTPALSQRGEGAGGASRCASPTGSQPSGARSGEGDEMAPRRPQSALLSPAAGALAAAAGALVLRYVHARDLALPMWGDSVHHTLIAGLIAAQGQVPADYGPLVPAQPFAYHFGFHAQAALLTWLAGMEPPRAVLFAGQLLSGLMVFPTYLLASRLAGDRQAGLVAGLVVGLVSAMPAYSVTWGRYPQVAGLAALPAAAYLTTRAVAGGKLRWPELVAAAVASAGVVLTHPRVALLYGCLLLAHLLVGHRPVSLVPWLRCGLVALLAAGLVAPWLVRLAGSRAAEMMLEPGPASAFRFPTGLLTTGFDRYLLAGAIAGVGLDLLLRRRAGVEVALWVGLSLAAANVRLLGLPFDLMLTNDALAIALFLPVAVLDGVLAVSLASLVRLDVWPRLLRLALAALLVGLGWWGGVNLAGVVNPACILATSADVEAIRWVAANTPPDAAFLINSYRWQGDVYQGSDGGYWLSTLAGRRTSLPPQVYAQGKPAEVARIRELAEATRAEPLDPAALLPLLRASGLTHVFVGARGGALSAELFEGVPGYRLVYANGRASVFEVEYGVEASSP